VIGDDDKRAGIDVGPHGAGGAGQHHRFGAEEGKHFERHAHRIDVAGFIVVRAAAENRHSRRPEHADHEFDLLGARGPSEARQLVVGNDDGLADLVGNAGQTRAEDEPDVDARLANLRAHHLGAFFRVALHYRPLPRRITGGS
jgi:hypothetical protein